jgi:purine-nucleoside phosphorylase
VYAGHFLVFNDHINLLGANPLRGLVTPGKTRFVDLTVGYDAQLRGWIKQSARPANAKMIEGVYLAVSGPSYETPAEIRAFGRLGADAVGMSTVPEVIVARQCGLGVAAIACITNLAAGRSQATLSHEDVLRQSERVKASTSKMLSHFAKLYGKGR